MNYSKRVSLKFRLTLLAVILIILPMGVATFYNSYNFSRNAKNEMMNSLESQNYSISQIIDIQIEKINNLTEDIAQEKGITVTLQFDIKSQLKGYIQNLEKDNELIDELVIYNTSSKEFIGNKENDFLHEAILKANKSDNFFNGIFKTNEFNIISIVPIRSDTDNIIGLVGIKSSMIKHTDYIRNTVKDLKMDMVLLDGEEIVLFAKSTGYVYLPFEKEKINISDNNQKEMFGLEESVKIEGNNFYIFLNTIRDIYGEPIGYVGTIKDTQNLVNSIKSIRKNMIYIALSGIVVAIIIFIAILNYLLAPLKHLIKTLEEIREGNLEKRFEVKNNDEIGIVGKYLNSTAERIETDVKELDEANKKLKKLDKIKDKFLANMSHEIRTPMNGIIGMTEILSMTDLDKKQREFLDAIDLSANNLLGIINDILDISKIRAGKIEIDNIDFNLEKLVTEVTNIVVYKAHKKGLELVVDIHKDVPEILEGDEGKIRQILLNLVSNAVKFTHEGSILISITKVDEEEDKIELNFSVKDTGIGISPDKKDRIFYSFEQGDLSYTKEYQGTGLGLSISKRLVDIMGGEIGCESEVGEGSEFYFNIPVEKSTRELKNIEYMDLKLDRLSILFIDDNELNRKITKKMLTQEGATVYLAKNGADGLDVLERERNIDLILLDVHMEDMDGFTTAKRIRQQFGSNPNILMFTSIDIRDNISKMRELGVEHYLIKPVRRHELFNKIKLAFNKKIASNIEKDIVDLKNIEKIKNMKKQNPDILIVEDNMVNMSALENMIQGLGEFNILKANNGEMAIEIYQKEFPDLVLMDIQMPILNGVEAFKTIDKVSKGKNKEVSVFAVTAYATQKDKVRFLDIGMKGVISKPFKMNDIRKVLEREFN